MYSIAIKLRSFSANHKSTLVLNRVKGTKWNMDTLTLMLQLYVITMVTLEGGFQGTRKANIHKDEQLFITSKLSLHKYTSHS